MPTMSNDPEHIQGRKQTKKKSHNTLHQPSIRASIMPSRNDAFIGQEHLYRSLLQVRQTADRMSRVAVIITSRHKAVIFRWKLSNTTITTASNETKTENWLTRNWDNYVS